MAEGCGLDDASDHCSSNRFHGDAGGFEAGADFRGEIVGAGRVAVDADRVGLERARPSRRSPPRVRSFTIRTARATTASASWMTEPGLRRDASEPSGS